MPIGAASLDNGRKQFQINCAVCHGSDGTGTKNPLLTKYGMTRSLVAPETQARTDGYIFGMIRNGRGLMPSYNRIEEPDRWDVVNYVRALQGRAGTPAITGPVGYPGENGNTVPRASLTAPTRPAPYVHPSMGPSAPAAPGHAEQPDSTKPAAPAAKGAH
jgi:cytochrome c553